MTPIRIEGPADPRIADYHAVSDSELLRQRGLFVAEGRLVVQRVMDNRRFPLRSMLMNETNYRALSGTLARVAPDVPLFVCDTADFLGVTGFNLHRGCLALVERPAPTASCEILRDAATIVVLGAVTNADNVGGVFRNVAAFGADGVLLSPTCCDPFYRKAIRTSMGAVLRVPYARAENWPAALDDVRAAGFTVVALTPREPSETLDAFHSRRPRRLALMVGTEGAGLTPAVEAAADQRARIPTSGEVGSLTPALAPATALS